MPHFPYIEMNPKESNPIPDIYISILTRIKLILKSLVSQEYCVDDTQLREVSIALCGTCKRQNPVDCSVLTRLSSAKCIGSMPEMLNRRDGSKSNLALPKTGHHQLKTECWMHLRENIRYQHMAQAVTLLENFFQSTEESKSLHQHPLQQSV